MSEFDTAELLGLARDGGQGAKAALLSNFREYIRLLAHLHMKPIFNAKFDESDIVQETLLLADRAFDQFRGSSEKEFAAWLRQIMANKGAAMARGYLAGKRDVQLEVRLQDSLDASSLNIAKIIPAESETPSAIAMDRERSMQVAIAISKVGGDKREVLILHGLQGMTINSVAKSMGRTEASTWKLWARGLQELRQFAMEVM